MEGGGGRSGLSEDRRKGGNGAISAAGRLRVVINWLPPPLVFPERERGEKEGIKRRRKDHKMTLHCLFFPSAAANKKIISRSKGIANKTWVIFSASKGGFSTSLFLSYFPFSPMLESGGLPPFFFPSLHFRKGGQKTIFLKRKEKEGGTPPRRRRSHLPKKKSQP